jgi:hypothetical protein
MKSMHLLLAAVLLTAATVWARAAAQGIEQALVSIGVEYCLKVLRGRTKALQNRSDLFGRIRISKTAFENKISEK